MGLQLSESEGIVVAQVSGTLDVEYAPEVRDQVLAAVSGAAPRVVVDLSGVERVFSSGLSALLTIHKDIMARGGAVVFCGARPFFREVLAITMLDRVFSLAPDREAAVDLLRQHVRTQ